MNKQTDPIGTLGVLLLAGAAIVAAAIFLPDQKHEEAVEITDGRKKRFYRMSIQELKDELQNFIDIEDYKACVFIRNLIQEKTGVNQIKD